MSSPELQQLLRVLDERDLNLHNDNVAKTLRSKEASDGMRQWVNKYLDPTTLLTKEELTLYDLPDVHIGRNDGGIVS